MTGLATSHAVPWRPRATGALVRLGRPSVARRPSGVSMRPGATTLARMPAPRPLEGDVAAQAGEGGLRRVVGRDAAAGPEPGDRRDRARWTRRRPCSGRAAWQVRKWARTLTSKTWSHCSTVVLPSHWPAPMPTLTHDAVEPLEQVGGLGDHGGARVGVGRRRPRRPGRGRPRRGPGWRSRGRRRRRCRRTRPWRPRMAAVTAMARPLPGGASGIVDLPGARRRPPGSCDPPARLMRGSLPRRPRAGRPASGA